MYINDNGQILQEDELMHYGVPGMKWGVYKGKSSLYENGLINKARLLGVNSALGRSIIRSKGSSPIAGGISGHKKSSGSSSHVAGGIRSSGSSSSGSSSAANRSADLKARFEAELAAWEEAKEDKKKKKTSTKKSKSGTRIGKVTAQKTKSVKETKQKTITDAKKVLDITKLRETVEELLKTNSDEQIKNTMLKKLSPGGFDSEIVKFEGKKPAGKEFDLRENERQYLMSIVEEILKSKRGKK